MYRYATTMYTHTSPFSYLHPTHTHTHTHSHTPIHTLPPHLVYETHTTWSTSVRTTSRNLLVMMELPSANPNREWSVNTVLTLIMPA